MFKKIIFVFVVIFLFLGCKIVYADVIINEIMYDLSGSDSIDGKNREWIELHNNGTSTVEITGDWRFNDGTSHYINDKNSLTLLPNDYIILAGSKDIFLTDYPSYVGIVVSTSMSLSNTGKTLKILNAEGDPNDTVTFSFSQGANGDGNSLQLINGIWKGASPTPGAQNTNIVSGSEPVANSSTTNSSSNLSSSVSKVTKNFEPRTKIIAKNFGFIGVPIEFSISTTGYSGEPVVYGKYFWNFGDGSSKETKINDSKFSHIYFYEGEYPVVLDYYGVGFSEIPTASDKIIIKITLANISISNIGNAEDFFIEISNDTNYDANISEWVLLGNLKSFIFPKNSIIQSKKKIILSPKITGFSIMDKDSLELLNSQRETIFEYSAQKPVKISTTNFSPKSFLNQSNPIRPTGDISTENQISMKGLKASAVDNDVKNNSNLMYGIGLVVFLGFSSSAAYFIRSRNRKVSKTDSDDFEILDE